MNSFTFDNAMIERCLKANGWSHGWDGIRWVHISMNADKIDYTLKEAFKILLTSNNLYGKQFEYGWKE